VRVWEEREREITRVCSVREVGSDYGKESDSVSLYPLTVPHDLPWIYSSPVELQAANVAV
jgi:hypothetical protein